MTSFLKWPAAIIAPALVASAVAASPVASSATPHTANYNVATMSSVTTIMLDGTYAFGIEGKMDDKLQGDLCMSPYSCVEAEYNNWVFAPISAGAKALDSAVMSIKGNKVVFGYSRGAAAAQEWIDANVDNASAPSAEQLGFVFVGNPYRKYGGSMADEGKQLSTGAYNIVDISNEYDSVSDQPDARRGTWFARSLARRNAKLSQHLAYDDVDLSRSDLLVYVEENPGGGTTTYVLVPTENLPILDGLRAWFPKWADKLQKKWEPLIDSTYDRSKFTPAGPGGVQLPFADEESTTVEMMEDETISSFSSSPARSARQSVAPEPDPEPVVEDTAFSSDDTVTTNTPTKREVEPEPEVELELDSEPKLDQEPNLSNETEEEPGLKEDLEPALENDAPNEESSKTSGNENQSLNKSDNDDDENGNESGSSPNTGGDNGSTESSDSSNDD